MYQKVCNGLFTCMCPFCIACVNKVSTVTPSHPHKQYRADCLVIYLTGGGKIMWKTATWKTEKKMLEQH